MRVAPSVFSMVAVKPVIPSVDLLATRVAATTPVDVVIVDAIHLAAAQDAVSSVAVCSAAKVVIRVVTAGAVTPDAIHPMARLAVACSAVVCSATKAVTRDAIAAAVTQVAIADVTAVATRWVA
jgi:hypothetical protein